jgi:hypothetical protein
MWEHVKGWRAYERDEPWGDKRADDRAAANTMWVIGAGHTGDLPEHDSPEHQAKLKAAREKYWREKGSK